MASGEADELCALLFSEEVPLLGEVVEEPDVVLSLSEEEVLFEPSVEEVGLSPVLVD